MTSLPSFFLAAIRANPDDDAPRLAAADWFAENGQPERGELIRAGVAMARHPDCPTLVADRERGRPNPLRCGTCEYCTPRRACERLSYVRIWDGGPYAYLLGDVGWADIVAEIDQGDCPLFIVWRGFAERVSATAEWWLQHADALLAAHHVTEVRLTTWPDMGALESEVIRRDKAGRDDIPPPGSLYGLGMAECVPVMLGYFWPQVRAWNLPPEPVETVTLEARRLTTLVEIPNEILADARVPDIVVEVPVPLGVMEVETRRPAAPARPRNTRMPAWLAAQRRRPGR